MSEIIIRKAAPHDHDQIWQIIREVIIKGDTYVFSPDSSREKMLGYWCSEHCHTYVAEIDNEVAGTFIIKDNQPGLGSHVANASFMTSFDHSGKGVGTAMGEWALKEAKRLGYKSMQFNIVVKTNDVAVKLWEKLGFQIVGEVPEVFWHRERGFVNAYIMWRKL